MIELVFDEERTTKGTVVFAARSNDEEPAVKTLYLRKAAVPDLNFNGNTGRKIRVTVEPHHDRA